MHNRQSAGTLGAIDGHENAERAHTCRTHWRAGGADGPTRVRCLMRSPEGASEDSFVRHKSKRPFQKLGSGERARPQIDEPSLPVHAGEAARGSRACAAAREARRPAPGGAVGQRQEAQYGEEKEASKEEAATAEHSCSEEEKATGRQDVSFRKSMLCSRVRTNHSRLRRSLLDGAPRAR